MLQLGLFESDPLVGRNPSTQVQSIQGLSYYRDFISLSEAESLWNAINNEPWLTDLKRRVQHYGYKYDYRKRSLDRSMFIGVIPQWSEAMVERMVQLRLINCIPDQVIVNEYLPGQGISDHIDCEPCFEDTIVSLSLGTTCIMELKKKGDRNNKVELLLEPRSLTVISGESRYNWSHGIPAREKDNWNGDVLIRKTRISLTFRKVIL